MIIQTLLCLGTMYAQLSALNLSLQLPPSLPDQGKVVNGVKTTAYTHTEADHLEYGANSAIGKPLKNADVHSAAADWSVYPQGTTFQIEGDKTVYVVDDYGSALVGTGTIDIYQPTKAAMNEYGVRKVNLRVIKWGSRAESLAILKPRAGKASHVREMISKLEADSKAG